MKGNVLCCNTQSPSFWDRFVFSFSSLLSLCIFTLSYRSESESGVNGNSKVLNPRKDLEEEYLNFEAKV